MYTLYLYNYSNYNLVENTISLILHNLWLSLHILGLLLDIYAVITLILGTGKLIKSL